VLVHDGGEGADARGDGGLVNAIALVGRQVGNALAGLRTADDLSTGRWFETFRLSGTSPDQPDLSPKVTGPAR
jgi:hypothetical protein